MKVPLPDNQQLLRQARSFSTKKQLGQHFLVDTSKLSAVAGALDLEAGDRVVEIGRGIGFLTRYLCLNECKVWAVDLDRQCVEELEKQDLAGLTIIHDDFLNYNLSPLLENLSPSKKLKIVGNVPYQITAPIVRHIFGEIHKPSPWLASIDRLVMTIQEEVALRMVAQPGTRDYSQITLLVNYFCRPEIIERVPSSCFYPEPMITSAVVRLTPHQSPPVSCRNPKLLKQIIQDGFGHRRKMLKNNLAASFSPQVIADAFKQLKLNPLGRAEGLSLEQFALLSDTIEELCAN